MNRTFFLFLTCTFCLMAFNAHAKDSSVYEVTCKAKLLDSDANAIVQDMPAIAENDKMIIHRTKISDVEFEVQEWKNVFFYQPFIRFSGGQEITTSGYFDATGAIKLYSTSILPSGVQRKVDVRCCRGCSYSDWPKK